MAGLMMRPYDGGDVMVRDISVADVDGYQHIVDALLNSEWITRVYEHDVNQYYIHTGGYVFDRDGVRLSQKDVFRLFETILTTGYTYRVGRVG